MSPPLCFSPAAGFLRCTLLGGYFVTRDKCPVGAPPNRHADPIIFMTISIHLPFFHFEKSFNLLAVLRAKIIENHCGAVDKR